MNTDIAANDLTQLSSREQLSALMDSALPADQTRFLLRRLQHDAPLAECWERWRIAGEVMRGLAPAQRMPADFAARVAASLRDGDTPASGVRSAGRPAWLRWGGGAALAASLAVVALMARQSVPTDAPQAAQVAEASTPPQVPAPRFVEPAPALDAGSKVVVAATAVAAVSVPQRKAQRAATRAGAQVQPLLVGDAASDQGAAQQLATLEPAAQMPQADIVTRPWPRAVLPQYAGGGFTVGFGEQARGNPPYNPFQPHPAIGNLTPVPREAEGGTADDAQQAAGSPQDP